MLMSQIYQFIIILNYQMNVKNHFKLLKKLILMLKLDFKEKNYYL